MKIKVLAIAPYQGLKDLLLDVCNEFPQIELDVEVADLTEGSSIAVKAAKKGYNAIISRGATSYLIKREVNIPIVDIPVSGYDILGAFTLIKNSNTKIAMIGYCNICRGAAAIAGLINMNIPIYTYQDYSDVGSVIREAIDEGCQVVIGDVVTINTVRAMGYPGILITSGRESVLEAFNQVMLLHETLGIEKIRVDRYLNIMESCGFGIITTNSQQSIDFINTDAATLLGVEKKTALMKDIAQVAPFIEDLVYKSKLDTENSTGRFIDIKGKTVFVKTNPIPGAEPSTVISLFEGNIQRTSSVVQTLATTITFSHIIGTDPVFLKCINKAKSYSKLNKNLWITGERGSGKSTVAQAIHSESRRRNNLFYIFQCDFADKNVLESELFGNMGTVGIFQTIGEGTLYLKDIDKLDMQLQERLFHEMQKNPETRIIASTCSPAERLLKKKVIHEGLFYAINQLHLHIPPLRERIADIEELVRMIIASLNAQHGKQIAGMREEACELISIHKWNGNVSELINFITEAFVISKGPYIQKDEIESILKDRHMRLAKHAETGMHIDLSGTWEDIEKRILLMILKEEGMNQTRTASRLSINRSTLWRKISNMMQNETNDELN